MSAISSAIDALLRLEAIRATKYLNEKWVVRASRRTFNGKIHRGNIEVVLTIGKPNYQERDFIKKCKRAGESFPIRKIQLKFLSKRK